MTTVAYQGNLKTGRHFLAADRRLTYGGTPLTTTKIIRLTDGSWFAQAGTTLGIQRFLEWYNAGAVPALRPPSCANRDEDVDFEGIQAYVDNDRTVHVILWTGEYCCEEVPADGCYVVGSGGAIAAGALAARASLLQAIQIASRYDLHSGNGVQLVDLVKSRETFYPPK